MKNEKLQNAKWKIAEENPFIFQFSNWYFQFAIYFSRFFKRLNCYKPLSKWLASSLSFRDQGSNRPNYRWRSYLLSMSEVGYLLICGIQSFQKPINTLDSGACPGPDPGFTPVAPFSTNLHFEIFNLQLFSPVSSVIWASAAQPGIQGFWVVAKGSIMNQTFLSKISPPPSFPKRGIPQWRPL